ncbi:MAG: hypothetical protein CEO22_47 [Candidatus Berkelbacteria bacterium Gr01-1014_85]|uniref:Uncharacterized protein n=1 Tax=Candidatus Berkelbacteria bacterium Gr01-1014_85 TaxID=2017150 RepID=A0A554JE37_9BACT|nr:MAG: hypothetical protein CEO22_47 [Candidatus Berkelbacteria bacterium Gr01-1014_85]
MLFTKFFTKVNCRLSYYLKFTNYSIKNKIVLAKKIKSKPNGISINFINGI